MDSDLPQATQPTNSAERSHVATVLKGAKHRLETTQELLNSTTKNYTDSTKLLVETQSALATVKAQLAGLTNSTLKLVSQPGFT